MNRNKLIGLSLLGIFVAGGAIGSAIYLNDYTVRTYYESKQVKTEEQRSFFKQHGMTKEYFENGQLKRESAYVRGKLEGISTLYDTKGNVLGRFTYQNGLKEGDSHIYLNQQDIDLKFKNDQLDKSFVIDYLTVQFGENRTFSATWDANPNSGVTVSGSRVCSDGVLVDQLLAFSQKDISTTDKIKSAKAFMQCVSITDVRINGYNNEQLTFKGNINYPKMLDKATVTLTETPEKSGIDLPFVRVMELDRETKKLESKVMSGEQQIAYSAVTFENGLAGHLGDFLTVAENIATMADEVQRRIVSEKELEQRLTAIVDQAVNGLDAFLSDMSFGNGSLHDLQGRLVSKSEGRFNLMKGLLDTTYFALYNQDQQPMIESEIKSGVETVVVKAPQSLRPVLSFKIKAAPSFQKDYVNLAQLFMQHMRQTAQEEILNRLNGTRSLASLRYDIVSKELGLKALQAILTGLSIDDFTVYDINGNKISSFSLKYNGSGKLSFLELLSPDIIDGEFATYENNQKTASYRWDSIMANPEVVLGVLQEKQADILTSFENFGTELKQMVDAGYPDFGPEFRSEIDQLDALLEDASQDLISAGLSEFMPEDPDEE